MKTLFVTIFFLFLESYSIAQWVETSTPITNKITDISFINTNTGFASTSRSGDANNYILKTINKGANWSVIDTFANAGVNSSIDFINESTGYFSTNDKVYKTVNGGTEEIPVTRYPIVKVQRINASNWGNYVVYSSNNIQSDPDIEGSKTNLAYLINYSQGNGQFKKVAGVNGYLGYFCQPSIFTGTDSRLINNSFSGSFGSNLSLLTLSPQSSLYKIDKQNFIITNISDADAFNIDNIDGVVNLDIIKY
ncbi:MAG: hypothetical protein SGI89_10660 [bacterium]|nr:hypothetical protein [bacterium]